MDLLTDHGSASSGCILLRRRINMRNVSALIATLSFCGILSAQQAASPAAAQPSHCPSGFSVRIDGRAIARSVSDLKEHGSGPLLDIYFPQSRSSKLVGATIKIHGLSPSGYYLPVGKNTELQSAIQVLNLEREGTDALRYSEAWSSMQFISWIELRELRYEDKTIWHPSGETHCSITPSRLLFIDAVAQ